MYTIAFILIMVNIYTTGISLSLQSFNMYMDTSYNVFYIWHFPLLQFPLLVPASTYLAPSSCDRNGPLQSQVARKLIPFVPHCSLILSLPEFPTLPGFPEPNVLLIKAHHNPLSSIQHSYPIFYVKCMLRWYVGYPSLIPERMNVIRCGGPG